MPELVDAERVPVEPRRAPEILPERVRVAVVVLLAADVPVELVEPEDESRDLRGGNDIALARAGLPIDRPGAGFLAQTSAGKARARASAPVRTALAHRDVAVVIHRLPSGAPERAFHERLGIPDGAAPPGRR